MNKEKIIDYIGYWLVNDRYTIYKSDGCVYDTQRAKDIPQWVFELRDTLWKRLEVKHI